MEEPIPPEYYDEPMPITRDLQQAELTRWQLETMEEIELLKHTLRGEVWSDEEKKWEFDKRRRLMNDVGIEVIAGEISHRVNKITTMSNLDTEQIYNIIKRFEVNLARMITLNYKNWNIKGVEFCYSIRDLCVEFVLIGLERAHGKTFMTFLERAKQYIEKKQIIGDQPRRLLFG